MSNIKHITIPQPCHQSWQQMEERGQGRHCASCAKVVVDFSKMTNDEILAFLAGTSNVCGRFNEFQIPNVNYQLDREHLPKTLGWKKWLAAVTLLAAGFVNRAMGQAAPASPVTTQQNVPDNSRKDELMGKVIAVDTPSQRIHGVIIGADDKLPVPGAYIKIKGTNTGVQADTGGRFELYLGNIRPVLVVSYIGYVTREVNLSTPTKKCVTIGLQPSQMTMGEVVVTQPRSVQSRTLMLYQYMPWPINNLSNLFK